jgi:hypothetical protein
MKKPHNFENPIDMRKDPVCYLCGGQWDIESLTISRSLLVIVCVGCTLRTRAKIDEGVLESRRIAKVRQTQFKKDE